MSGSMIEDHTGEHYSATLEPLEDGGAVTVYAGAPYITLNLEHLRHGQVRVVLSAQECMDLANALTTAVAAHRDLRENP